MGLVSACAVVGFAGWGTVMTTKGKDGTALFALSGAFGLSCFVSVILEIVEIKKLRDKHGLIYFTGNGVVFKF